MLVQRKIFSLKTTTSLLRIIMKFLIIQKIKREVPIEKWAKLLPLQFKYFENLEKEKTLEVTTTLLGSRVAC